MNICYYNTVKTQYRLEYLLEHCIMAVAFFLPLSSIMTDVFLMAAIVLWIGKMIALKNIDWKMSPVNPLIVIFIVISAISIGMSPNRGLSSYNYIYLMGRYMIVYYLVLNNINMLNQVKKVVWMFMASALAVCLYGFYQYIFDVKMLTAEWVDFAQFPELKTRVFSTLKNPNILAGYLVTMIALALGTGLKSPNNKVKGILFTLAACFSACLVFTYSRGAWLTLVFIIFICGLQYNRRMLWLLLFIPVGLLFAHDAVFERVMSIINPTDTSSALRIALWESTVAMILEHPLMGIGWGAYHLVYPEYNFFIEDASTIIYHAHNMYLNFAAEIGIPGLAVFLMIIYFHMKYAIEILKTASNRFATGFALGSVASLWGVIISGFSDYVLFNIELSMLFWFINALIMVVRRQEYII